MTSKLTLYVFFQETGVRQPFVVGPSDAGPADAQNPVDKEQLRKLQVSSILTIIHKFTLCQSNIQIHI